MDEISDEVAGEIVARFSEVWSDPPGHGYRFLEPFSPTVRLAAPLAGRTRGVDAGYEAFRRTFAVFPDLTALVDGWACDGTRLYIAMRFRTAAAAVEFQWPSVDVLTFEGGKVAHRRAYFDPLPLIVYMLRHPRLIARYLRVRLGGARLWPTGEEQP